MHGRNGLVEGVMTEPFLFKAAARLVDFMRQADDPELLNLAAGVPSLEALPTTELAVAFQRALATQGSKLFGYHNPEGDYELRDLLAQRLSRRGAAVSGSDLFTTTGCTQGLSVMLSVLVQPGDVVAFEAPAYYGMLELLAQVGARALPLPLSGADGIDVDLAEALLTRWKPRCLVVCSSLSNPSGATLPEASRERLVEICRRLGVRIIEDDIYAELVDGGAPKPMRAFDDGSTVSWVTSFSKSISPGLRVGVCAPGDLFEEAIARKVQQDLHSAVPTEVALREFLGAGCFDPHLESLRIRNAGRRELALATVARCFPAGTQVNPPNGGYMLWARLPGTVDFASVRAKARSRRVAFAAGDVFFAGPAPSSGVRLNCDRVSEPELVFALETLGELLS